VDAKNALVGDGLKIVELRAKWKGTRPCDFFVRRLRRAALLFESQAQQHTTNQSFLCGAVF
jgi:hypothetical protein